MKIKRVTNNSLEKCNKTRTDQIIERYKKNFASLKLQIQFQRQLEAKKFTAGFAEKFLL